MLKQSCVPSPDVASLAECAPISLKLCESMPKTFQSLEDSLDTSANAKGILILLVFGFNFNFCFYFFS
jgi:hypothetical protein